MKFFRNLFSKTCIGKFVDTIQSLYYYIKDYNTIADVFYGNDFKNILKRYLNIDVEKDWIGRLYGVINPNIDIKGHFNISNMIIELDGDNTNNNEYLKTWAHKQLIIVSDVFKAKNLFTYIDMQFEHVGPINADNYLIIFDIVSRQTFTYNLKRFIKHLLFYIVIAIIVLGIIACYI